MNSDTRTKMEVFYLINVYIRFGKNGENQRYCPRTTVKMSAIPSPGDMIHLSPETINFLNLHIRTHNRLYNDSMPMLRDVDCFKVVSRMFPETGLYGNIDANIYVGYGKIY